MSEVLALRHKTFLSTNFAKERRNCTAFAGKNNSEEDKHEKKIVDYTEISLLLEKSSFSDDLVKQVADYCNTHGMYYSVSTYTYLAEPPRRTANCITIFYGMRGSIPTFLAYRFKYKPDNSFYSSQGLDYEFTDDSLVVENGNFSKLSDIVGSFSFTEQQLKDKYKTDNVTNVTYNTNNNYSSDNNVNNNILDSIKMNNPEK